MNEIYAPAAQAKGYGYADANSAVDGAKVARQTEIPRYGEELAKALAACSQGLEQLESRLSCVTSTEPPSAGREGSNPTAVPQCDMGRRLQEMGAQALSLGARIQSLVRRLEA